MDGRSLTDVEIEAIKAHNRRGGVQGGPRLPRGLTQRDFEKSDAKRRRGAGILKLSEARKTK